MLLADNETDKRSVIVVEETGHRRVTGRCRRTWKGLSVPCHDPRLMMYAELPQSTGSLSLQAEHGIPSYLIDGHGSSPSPRESTEAFPGSLHSRSVSHVGDGKTS